MFQTNSSTFKIAEAFKDYCDKKHYQVQKSEEEYNLRLDISNLSERTIVKIFHKGTLQVQGKQNSLKAEMEELKEKFVSNPQSFLGDEGVEIKACATRYDIMLPELRIKIKESLDVLEAKLEFTGEPTPNVEYRAKITKNESSLTLTQFNNGTLLLQGKEDELFDNSCDLIEKIANPSDKEVISRFISSNEENLKIFVAKYTPELLTKAEKNVHGKIGDVFNYLQPYDQKWFVASKCLCLTQIPLPEFSPLVMPVSKAFEGFVKKLLVDIGLFDSDHFKTKQGNFSALSQSDNPKRKAICAKDKYADTILKKISLCLDMSRNFMMHSDDNKITKVDSQQEAEEKVNSIFKETKEIFDYFNDLYSLLPK